MTIRKLQQRRQRRQRERQKSNRFRLTKQQTLHGASPFFVHFFAVTAQIPNDLKMPTISRFVEDVSTRQ